MSKSLKLYGVLGVASAALMVGAHNFADRFVAPMPDNARVLSPESASPDMMFIAAARAEAAADAKRLGVGREALPEEIAAWDVDVSPDGTGLPEGSGSVMDGEELFVDYCAVCHGDFAEGVGNWPSLAGGDGTLANEDPVKTVGSYWPYLSTAWDYVHRSMPFGAAQTLSADETYAIVAYILYSNYLVEDDFVLSKDNFLEVEMPNADGFIVDDRPETEYGRFSEDACMENCKDSVEITMHASVLDVTPDEEGAEEAAEAMEEANADTAADEKIEEMAEAAEPAAESEAAAEPEAGEPAETAEPPKDEIVQTQQARNTVVEQARAEWADDPDQRRQARVDSLRAAIEAVCEEPLSKSELQARAYPGESVGQNERTWFRKTVKPWLKEVAEYSNTDQKWHCSE